MCLKLSELTLDIGEHILSLNYNFYTRFADIVESNESNLKLELLSFNQIVLTREEVRLFHDHPYSCSYQQILYWKGYDAVYSKSKTNMLDLIEGILENITSYLCGNDLHAFYLTCKQSQKLVQKHYSENIFYSSAHSEKIMHENVFKDLNVFKNFGEHIFRMLIDFVDSNEAEYGWMRTNCNKRELN